MSLVSIIIPYFKKKNYIISTINSILKQNYRNYEIFIIYDDEDKSDLNFIANIKKIDKRINLIINIKNLGVGSSRNKAIKYCKGEYVAFIDADDLWKKNKLKKQIEFMKKNNLNVSHTSYDIIDKNNKIKSLRKARNLSYKDLVKSCDIGLSTVILKRNLLNHFKFAKLSTKEDYVLWLKLSKKGYKFYGLNQNLASWRLTANSLSSSNIQKLIDGFRVYNQHMKYNFFKSIYYLFCLSLNFLKKRFND